MIKRTLKIGLLWLCWAGSVYGNTESTVPIDIDIEAIANEEIELNEEQPFVLNAIVLSQTRRVAVVNGELVQEGDMIAGKMVKNIKNNAVLLVQNGIETELKIHQAAMEIQRE